MPDAFFEVVAAGMHMPGWREAMWTHLNLALRFGRQRPGQALTEEELQSIEPPVLFIWGQDDVYGGPKIGGDEPSHRSPTHVWRSSPATTRPSSTTRCIAPP